MAADRRTLIIAVVAMIALVSVGIVSAAVFTGSACQEISPTAVATADGDGSLDALLGELSPAAATAVERQVTELAGQFGAVSGVAVVDGADGLTATPSGPVATGTITSLLADPGHAVTAAADLGTGVVVGDGDALLSLARVNDLTGQVDAFASIDTTPTEALTEIGCVDTATVGTPLAFELDAGDGQLLLFRADEDGDDAEVELRDPREGRLWFTRVDVGMAPPGVTGERIDGRLGGDVAVLVRRTAPGEDVPLVTAFDRGDGAQRWQLDRAALMAGDDGVIRDDAVQRLEILALDPHQVVVAVTEARDEDAVVAGGTEALGPSVGPGHVVALDLRDGTPRWQQPVAAGVAVPAVGTTGTATWIVLDDADQVRLIGLDPTGQPLDATGESVLATADVRADEVGDGHAMTAAVVPLPADPDATTSPVLALLGEQLVVARPRARDVEVASSVAPDGLVPRDALVREGRLHVLFDWPPRDGAGSTAPSDATAGAAGEGRGVVVSFDLEG